MTIKNSVKGKKQAKKEQPKAFFVFAISMMIAEALIIIVLSLALTSALSGPKYTVGNDGTVQKVREDRPVKHGGIEDGDYVVGNKDSKAVFIWYVDMQCPACAQMAPIVQSLYDKYGDRVAFVTRTLLIPGHDYARPAAIAIEAASQQGYQWQMMMRLFARRAEWAYVSNNSMLKERFIEIFSDATEGNGDVNKFTAAYDDTSAGNNRISRDEKKVKNDNLNATPSIIIGGNFIDFSGSTTSTVELLSTEIEKALNN